MESGVDSHWLQAYNFLIKIAGFRSSEVEKGCAAGSARRDEEGKSEMSAVPSTGFERLNSDLKRPK